MILFKQAAALNNFLNITKTKKSSIGFVPTMGALHEGHFSLIKKAKQHTDIVVCSIFVNPTQFNDANDYEKYPVTLKEDILKLEETACDILFFPPINEVYPGGVSTGKKYDLGPIENVLEGQFRPGHFQGVCQVIERLLSIVNPDVIFVGQKDYQQSIIIKTLIKLLQLPVEVVTGLTLREPSGLAMSSRNVRLTNEEKEAAASIFKLLQCLNTNYSRHSYQSLEAHGTKFLLENGFKKVDYVATVDAKTLQPVHGNNGTDDMAILVAAYMGDTRLIDNLLLNTSNTSN